MTQLKVSNRQNALKRLFKVSLGTLLSKKFEFSLRALFLENFLYFLKFPKVTWRLVFFLIEVPLMTVYSLMVYSQMMPNEHKIRCQEIARIFFWLQL